MKTIDMASFSDRAPAEKLQHRFEQAGIPALVHDEAKLQRFCFLSPDLAAYKVEVPRHEFEHARDLLTEWDKTEDVLHDAVRCPSCGSPRIEYPQFTRKFVTPMLIEMGVMVGAFPREFYCESCQFTWPDQERVEPERDILGWQIEKKSP